MNIQDVLAKHRLWLENAPGGIRANLQGADLKGANLNGARLERAYLQDADLQGADLRNADLRNADLQGANLWDEAGNINETLFKSWNNSFKDAIHFFTLVRRR